MPTRRACSAKFRKYRAPVLSVFLHMLALAGILININASETKLQSVSDTAAFTVIAEADVSALPPWPVGDQGLDQTGDIASSVFSEFRGDVPLLQTSNDVLPLQASSPRPVEVQKAPTTISKPSGQQLAVYGHYDPAIFTAPEPAQHGQKNADTAQITSNMPENRPATYAGSVIDNLGVGEYVKGKFLVRIVTTKNSAYVAIDIIGGNMVMLSLLSETAQRYQTSAQVVETAEGYNGGFTAQVMAALP